MKQIRLLPAADHDIDQAADHFVDEGGIELGLQFLAAVEEAWHKLLDRPHLGSGQEWLSK